MTNKEKAREIAGGLNFPISGYESGEYDGALEMAKWKDQQFKEYLEKKRASIDNYAQAMMFSPFINEIINELFEADQKVG